MRVQRTRRPSLRSGRSRRSLGSPLTRHPLGNTGSLRALAALTIALIGADSTAGQRANRAEFRIEASHMEYLADMSPLWRLRINERGVSKLLLFSRIEKGEQPLVVPQGRIAALREAVRRERFFDLKESYGEMPVDGPERRMEIWDNGRHKKVEILTIRPGKMLAATDRLELGRALRVWMAIRDCFEAPGALDSRAEDRKFLSALKRAA
jgi:hypothetical protein